MIRSTSGKGLKLGVLTSLFLSLFLSGALLSGCSQEAKTIPSKHKKTSVGGNVDGSAFTAQVGIMAYTSLSNANLSAQYLDNKLASFMHHPNPTSQAEIQQAWRSAYDDFLATLIFSYLPIQDPADWHSLKINYQQQLIKLDSWPIEGGYIDYIDDYPFSGIVNDLTLNIDEESIRSQHGFTDPSNASLGFHALEFMLWGGNGERTAYDFFPQENTAPVPVNDAEHSEYEIYADTSESQDAELEPQNHNRRRQYTLLLSELLLKDLLKIQHRWQPSNGYYSQLLQKSSVENTLLAAFTAAQNLISEEMLTKRFQFNSSEFSQSSHLDLLALLVGIERWFMPLEAELQETSLLFLIQQANQQVADDFAQSLQQSKACFTEMSEEATYNDPAAIEQCKQDTIQLLSHLRLAAKVLEVKIPALD